MLMLRVFQYTTRVLGLRVLKVARAVHSGGLVSTNRKAFSTAFLLQADPISLWRSNVGQLGQQIRDFWSNMPNRLRCPGQGWLRGDRLRCDSYSYISTAVRGVPFTTNHHRLLVDEAAAGIHRAVASI